MALTKINHENAVSETIGFIIIFALMMTGIGLVTLYGYPMLMQEQQNANLRNMERNMIVLQNDLKNLVFKAIPYEETSLQVSGGSLSINSGQGIEYFTVNVSGSPFLPFPDGKFYPGQLTYYSDSGGIVSLENGAVLLRYENQPGSVMISEPRWFYDPPTNTLVVPLINLNADASLSQNGIGNVRMNLVNSSTLEDSGMVVDVEYHDPSNNFATAWNNYFQNSLHMSWVSGNIYRLNNIDRIVIKTYNITIENL